MYVVAVCKIGGEWAPCYGGNGTRFLVCNEDGTEEPPVGDTVAGVFPSMESAKAWLEERQQDGR